MNTHQTALHDPKPDMIPKPLARAMFALAIASLGLVAFAAVTGRAPVGQQRP